MVSSGIGKRVKSGEILLAHNGILFLDELHEFSSATIEPLRKLLETKEVIISKSVAHIKFPANFQLIAAINPCKCGYLNDSLKAYNKTPICSRNYQPKMSGPILDKFDLHIESRNSNEHYTYDHILNTSNEESSEGRCLNEKCTSNLSRKIRRI